MPVSTCRVFSHDSSVKIDNLANFERKKNELEKIKKKECAKYLGLEKIFGNSPVSVKKIGYQFWMKFYYTKIYWQQPWRHSVPPNGISGQAIFETD